LSPAPYTRSPSRVQLSTEPMSSSFHRSAQSCVMRRIGAEHGCSRLLQRAVMLSNAAPTSKLSSSPKLKLPLNVESVHLLSQCDERTERRCRLSGITHLLRTRATKTDLACERHPARLREKTTARATASCAARSSAWSASQNMWVSFSLRATSSDPAARPRGRFSCTRRKSTAARGMSREIREGQERECEARTGA
jgi:hypothetical protein